MPEIGATLREARMRAGLDISEAEQATKIRAKYLRALENEEWDLLPGPTFVRSFLRTYAEYLGLDARMLVEEYKLRHDSTRESELQPIGSGRPPAAERQRGPLLTPFRLVIVLIICLVAALYGVGRWANSGGGGDENAGRTNPGKQQRGKGKHKRKARNAPATAPHRARRVRLQVTATGEVYVCLVDGGGRRLIPGSTLTADSAPASFTAKRFMLTLGNANVELKVNDRPVDVTPSASAIGLRITPKGTTKPLPSDQQPTCT